MSSEPSSPPRVSVIVRTMERPTLLAEAMESLRRQSFQDFEVVLVDDGRTPPPEEVLTPAPGVGVTRIRPGGKGRAHALNEGVAAARGTYLAYLDDDDLYEREHLETLVRFLDGSDEYRVAYTDATLVSQKLGDDGRYHEVGRRGAFGVDFDPTRLLYSNYVPLICLRHEKALAGEAGGFDESFDLFEDGDFLIRLSTLVRFRRIPKATALYRVRDDGSNATQSRPWHSTSSQAAREALYKKHWSRRSPKTDVAFLDVLENERGMFEWEREDLRKALGDERERAAGSEKAFVEARQETERLRVRAANLDAELRATRGDAARQMVAAGDRERALAKERDELALKLDAMNRSLVWRLFTPYWKLKALLRR